MAFDEYFYLDKDFREMISNKDTLKKSIEKFLDNIIDDITLGIIFDVHRKHKTRGDLDLVAEQSTSKSQEHFSSVDDIFGNDNLKKELYCDCPICDQRVAACRFAPHLEACMGLMTARKRQSSRIANNNSNSNTNTKDKEDSSDITLPSDDEHDWNSRHKKNKKKKTRSKTKKGKSTPKKANSLQSELDSINVDVEGDEDGEVMLRDIMQDNSNQSSPQESVSSTNSSLKIRERPKSKKNKRDRTSPLNSLD